MVCVRGRCVQLQAPTFSQVQVRKVLIPAGTNRITRIFKIHRLMSGLLVMGCEVSVSLLGSEATSRTSDEEGGLADTGPLNKKVEV